MTLPVAAPRRPSPTAAVRPARTWFLAAAAAACALLGASPAATAHTVPGARGGEALQPATDLATTIRTRQRFFGPANVDPRTGALARDKVVLSWFGVSNFAAAIRGQVVLLDAWVPRGLHSGYVPTSPAELAQLDPDLVLLGHAHFDHAADAVPIAAASGARIAGLREHCDEMATRAAAVPPPCTAVLEPGEVADDVALLRGVEVRAVRHVHSGAQAPDGEDGYHVPVLPALNGAPLTHPPTPRDMAETVAHAPDAEGGSVLYRFRVGDWTMVWHDTSGPLKEASPSTFRLLRDLRPVDVELGAIQSFNQYTNGMRDPRMYIEALRPEHFVPHHHDDWAPGATAPASTYRGPLHDELARLPAEQRPSVTFLEDPRDYVTPLVFDVPLEPERLLGRCAGGGAVRARLAGDLADVVAMTVRVGRRIVGRRSAAPWQVRITRGDTRSGRRMSAAVVRADGSRTRLVRRLPRCGRR